MADYVTSSVDEDGVKNALVHFGIIQASQMADVGYNRRPGLVLIDGWRWS